MIFNWHNLVVLAADFYLKISCKYHQNFQLKIVQNTVLKMNGL